MVEKRGRGITFCQLTSKAGQKSTEIDRKKKRQSMRGGKSTIPAGEKEGRDRISSTAWRKKSRLGYEKIAAVPGKKSEKLPLFQPCEKERKKTGGFKKKRHHRRKTGKKRENVVTDHRDVSEEGWT